MVTRILGAVLLVLTTATVGRAQDIPVYVFTQTNNAGFVDEGAKRRQDSVKDLRGWLAKKKGIVLVEDAASAVVTLEVLASAQAGTGEQRTTTRNTWLGGVSGSTVEETAATLRTTLKVGDYTTELIGRNGQAFGAWKEAANAVAVQVDKWVRDNRAKLLPH
jgi:7-keto-8-aminopelargonate synthetase-like enzyme